MACQLTSLVSYCSSPGTQELHRVHREAWGGGRNVPLVRNRLKHTETSVREVPSSYRDSRSFSSASVWRLLLTFCPRSTFPAMGCKSGSLEPLDSAQEDGWKIDRL